MKNNIKKLKEKESITEKEWQSCGFKCKIIFVRQSHRCGYVRIPKRHVAFDKNYDDLPIEVHGGLTYGSSEGETNYVWFGRRAFLDFRRSC